MNSDVGLTPRGQHAVPRPRAGDVEQVALGLVNVVQLRLVATASSPNTVHLSV